MKAIKARGRYIFKKSKSIKTPHSIATSYESFNGYYSILFHLDEAESYDFIISVTSDAGQLDISVIGPNEISLFNKTNLSSSDIQLRFDTQGDYNITLEASNHKGSYKLTWQKENQ
ncbi:MAG: hypothetical protein WCP73_01105 [Eubacteriales bacterium]